MRIDLENTVTIRVKLSKDDLHRLMIGQTITELTEGEADEKPMYICITKDLLNE